MRPVILKSYLLSSFEEVVHGISTRIGSVNDLNFNLGNLLNQNSEEVHENRKIFFKNLGIDESKVVYQQQVHSSNFSFVNKAGIVKENDSLITTEKNLYLVVTIADCIPILFYDKVNQIVGVIHSGWRGTHLAIVYKTIDYAINELNLNRNNSYFYFGPSICSKCFEVDEDVATKFEPKFVKRKDKKFTVDLQQINLNYLLDLGIKKENIQISNLCTFEQQNLFHSYRRDKEKSGRMFGVIGLREK
jgi:YfiH family protein